MLGNLCLLFLIKEQHNIDFSLEPHSSPAVNDFFPPPLIVVSSLFLWVLWDYSSRTKFISYCLVLHGCLGTVHVGGV